LSDEAPDYAREICLDFAATLLYASANDVQAVCTVIKPAEVELLDAPTAVLYRAAVGVARNGDQPSPGRVHAELMRTGAFADHRGELVKGRMLDASTHPTHGVRLHAAGVELLAVMFRHRLRSMGQGLVEAAENSSEADCWELLRRDGAVLRGLWDRLAGRRPEVAA
jgi:hypothetical protein